MVDRGEHGQALPLVVIVLLLGGVLAVGLGRLGHDAGERARAQTAADAAALAGAADGPPAARALARANGAEVLEYDARGAVVTVTVQVGEATASARARRTVVDSGRGRRACLPSASSLAACTER